MALELWQKLNSANAILSARSVPQPPRRTVVPPDSPIALRRFPAAAYLSENRTRRLALTAVARHGVCVLSGCEEGQGGLEHIVAAFGFVRETNYGRLFDVRVMPSPTNSAFTDQGLAPHTDNPYREQPPALQLLHCIEAAQEGGETLLVDGFKAATDLRDKNPEAFALLASTPVRFAWRNTHTILEALAPVVSLSADGDVIGLRVNDRALLGPVAASGIGAQWHAAYSIFLDVIATSRACTHLSLSPGDILILDNRRFLHGRTGFADGNRFLQGCYADRCGLLSTLAVLEETEAIKRVDALLDTLAGPAGEESYGEGVSLRAHSLQAAAIARAQGRDEAFIAAALLHDIGWAVAEEPHELVGAARVAAVFGDAVSAAIRLHVDAKRYLVAAEPDYFQQLSAASLATLALQGGAMTAEEASAFAALPGSAEAIALRRIDEQAKEADAEGAPLESYRPLLHRLALTKIWAEDVNT